MVNATERANDAGDGDQDGDNEGDKDGGDRDTVAEGRGWQRENECTITAPIYWCNDSEFSSQVSFTESGNNFT